MLALAVAALVVQADPAEAEYLRLRESGRGVLRRNCGECHDGALKSARAKALKVFDTRSVNWAASMTEAQLRDCRWRLQSDIVPTADGDAKPIKISGVERSQFDAFIAAELGRRPVR